MDDHQNSVFAFERRSEAGERVLVISNFTPVPREGYRIGVNVAGVYEEILNTDMEYYKGSNVRNIGDIVTDEIESHGKAQSISIIVPPLATVYLKLKSEKKVAKASEKETKK